MAAIPGAGWNVLEWRMPNRDALEVLVNMPRPDPRALVEAWEGSGFFSNVTAELGRNADEVVIRARIVPQRVSDAEAAPCVRWAARWIGRAHTELHALMN